LAGYACADFWGCCVLGGGPFLPFTPAAVLAAAACLFFAISVAKSVGVASTAFKSSFASSWGA